MALGRMCVCDPPVEAFTLVYLGLCRQERLQVPDIYCLQGTIKQWVFVDLQSQEVYSILSGKYTSHFISLP